MRCQQNTKNIHHSSLYSSTHNVEPSKKPKLVIFKGPYSAVLNCRCQAAYTAVPQYTHSFFPFLFLCKNSVLLNKMMVIETKKFLY